MVIKYLLEKEFKQFLRNPFMKRLAIIFPLVIILVFPWVTTFEVKNVNVAVVDNDNSPASMRLIEKFNGSSYLSVKNVFKDYKVAYKGVEKGIYDVIVVVPQDFEKNLRLHKQNSIQINANSVNGMKGGIGSGYVNSIIMDFTAQELRIDSSKLIAVDEVNRFNPTLDYRRFMIPALITMVLIMLCGFLPALNIVSEKEIGTIEQINVTPVSKSTFILAKLIPYWLMGLFVITICFLLAWVVYGFLPVGSFFNIYLAAFLFILIMSGIGLIISNSSGTMQQAMFLMFFFVMIFTLMCGLFTPVKSMPGWAQNIAFFVPPRYFVNIMRSVYLKGAGLLDNGFNYLMLSIFAIVIYSLAIISYRKN